MAEPAKDRILDGVRYPFRDRKADPSGQREQFGVLPVGLDPDVAQAGAPELRVQLANGEVPRDQAVRLTCTRALEVQTEPPCEREEPRRSLRVEELEARVAPNALWSD